MSRFILGAHSTEVDRLRLFQLARLEEHALVKSTLMLVGSLEGQCVSLSNLWLKTLEMHVCLSWSSL